MGKSELIAGLDLGSGRVVCVLGTPDPEGQGTKILGGAIVPTRGLKGGVVLNIHETARAIRAAVEKAEEQAGQMVHGLYIGVRGDHIQSFNNSGNYNIARTDKEITAEDVRGVIEHAKAIPISADREILHVIPQSFALDRQGGVPDPIGMEGALLEVDVHIVTASSSHVTNLTKAVAEGGFDVIEPVYSLLALGEFLVTEEERDLGSLLVDVGGQSISLGIFAEGGIKFSKELPFGSDFITRDLAHGLRTKIPTAERIKIEHGIAHPALLNGNGDDLIEFKGVDGRTVHSVKKNTMVDIILPRVEEMFTHIGEEVQNSNYGDLAVPGGTILTGGGSQLRGLAQAAEQILNMPARGAYAHPGIVDAPAAILEDPSYATALGLVCYPQSASFGQTTIARRTEGRVLRGLRRWFKDLF
ncbi:MAG: cell division protein FtsA [Elusimicrobia bacterium CG1_02_63_36]|nr:MAG: cell division protein FtsA [Elusimicrobia bacterium CG1_02_63_36]PIP84277.1 MAG: cell division protein FtsA [Elusimicrobia bacterium CG22_combo_CG10-13_8_21_14_all_63_91]PJA15646.1 MAG: cell division protein FtsA [Elusimicrobia bacterium CG_4_10_14_0_2_um_filter_63_34]PJB23716.1 MAG: cell division protein FtsA [Elusimicrobia bacterium CG_4_9_14_3_um_filter_62_55]